MIDCKFGKKKTINYKRKIEIMDIGKITHQQGSMCILK